MKLLFYKASQKSINQSFFWVVLLLIPSFLFSQIPNRAKEIADSIIKTRIICTNTIIELEDSTYYPKFKNEYNDRKTESCFFKYKVSISNNIVTNLIISLEENFSIVNLRGMPDKNYIFSPCAIMAREKLWEIAKNNGLKTKYKKCVYYLDFEEKGIFIRFLERKSKYNVDYYTLNAITGEYIKHTQINVLY